MSGKDDRKMDNIECAEYICDLLSVSERLNLNKDMCNALCKARYETMCKHSPIGKHKCSVKIKFMPQSEQKPISVDTCLQAEIQELIRKHGIWTIGSCCGHGIKQPYIQVDAHGVQKMLALGYIPIPIDKYGNGENCFVPKTILYRERRERDVTNEEAIKLIERAIAEIEWEYPMEYSAAFEKAKQALQREIENTSALKYAIKESESNENR